MDFRPQYNKTTTIYHNESFDKLSSILKIKDRQSFSNMTFIDEKEPFFYHYKEDLYYPKIISTEDYELNDFCSTTFPTLHFFKEVEENWNNEPFELIIYDTNEFINTVTEEE